MTKCPYSIEFTTEVDVVERCCEEVGVVLVELTWKCALSANSSLLRLKKSTGMLEKV